MLKNGVVSQPRDNLVKRTQRKRENESRSIDKGILCDENVCSSLELTRTGQHSKFPAVCSTELTVKHGKQFDNLTCGSETSEGFVCSSCKKRFLYKRSLIRHTKLVHRKGNVKPTGCVCPICDKYFKLRKHMFEHLRNVHRTAVLAENVYRGNLQCPLCKDSKHINLDTLREHLLNIHNFSVESEEHSFSNVDDFFEWKEKEEIQSKSKFVAYGQKKTSVSTKHYYRCHHSGYYRPQGTGKRLLQKQGSKKTGNTCSASIEMLEGSIVKVKYFKTHCGHDIKLKHLSLTNAEKSALADKLSQGVSMQTILNEVRKGSFKEMSRIQLLTRKDLWNIKKSFGLISKTQTYKHNLGKSLKQPEVDETPCTNKIAGIQLEVSTNENSYENIVEGAVVMIIEDKVASDNGVNSKHSEDFGEDNRHTTSCHTSACKARTDSTSAATVQQHISETLKPISSECNSSVVKDILFLLRTGQDFKDIAYLLSDSEDWIYMFSKSFKEKGHLTPNLNITLHHDGTCVISRQFVSEFSKVAPKDTERLVELLRVIQDDSSYCGEVPCEGMPLEFTYG